MKLVVTPTVDKKVRAAAKVAALLPVARGMLETSGQLGLTARELRRKHPGEDLIHYSRALYQASIELKAKSCWTGVRPENPASLQECRYHMPGIALTEEA